MGEPLGSDIPRFTAIPGRNGNHHSTGNYRTSGPGPSTDRRKSHRFASMVACATYHTYRLRVAFLSGTAFLATTGFTIYKAIGR